MGLGWVEPEYQALNEPFTNRGQRIDEQIGVLRALFTQEVVTFSGRWHQLEADAALRRVAALGAGWPMIGPQEAPA